MHCRVRSGPTEHDDAQDPSTNLFRQGGGKSQPEKEGIIQPLRALGRATGGAGEPRTVSARDLISIDSKVGYAVVRVVPGMP